MKQIGVLPKFYKPGTETVLPQRQLCLLPTYEGAVGKYEGGYALTLDLTYKVRRQETVLDYMKNRRNDRDAQNDYRSIITQELKGRTVMKVYGNQDTHRIESIEWDINPLATFTRGESEITYAQYILDQYPNVKLSDMAQPMLLVMPRNRRQQTATYIIPELCQMTGLDDRIRKDFQCMKDIANKTNHRPQETFAKLRGMSEQIGSSNPANSWNMSVNQASI